MLKAFLKGHSEEKFYSTQDLERFLQISYTKKLIFFSERYFQKIIHQSKKAISKKQLSLKEKWLGTHFKREIDLGYEPKISIRWINDILGYGIFAEEDIFPGSYIGEYTGLVRKRKKFRDRKNEYCFEYTIGDWIGNPFIIDAQKTGNFTRFINHSEKPNVESLSVYVGEVMHIIFISLKSISKGTELRYHYGDTFWKKRKKQILIN